MISGIVKKLSSNKPVSKPEIEYLTASKLHNNYSDILITYDQFHERLRLYVGSFIEYLDKHNIDTIEIVTVLNGGLWLSDELISILIEYIQDIQNSELQLKNIDSLTIHKSYVQINSYTGLHNDKIDSSTVKWWNTRTHSIPPRLLLIVDDLFDYGQTAAVVRSIMNHRNIPIKMLNIAYKTSEVDDAMINTISLTVDDMFLFDIPRRWVYGMGLDLFGYYRGLQEIRVLGPEICL